MAEYNASQFRFIKSSRGGNKLEENGFLYDKHKVLGEVTYWQCERRNDCKARLHTQGTQVIKRINDHLHGPAMQKVSCLETKAGIKRKATQTQDSTHHIIGEGLVNITEGTTVKLPKINSLKRTIQRERIENYLDEIVITELMVLQQLELVNEAKSPGPDNIHPKLVIRKYSL